MKMIKITTGNQISVHDFPDGGISEQTMGKRRNFFLWINRRAVLPALPAAANIRKEIIPLQTFNASRSSTKHTA